MDNASQNVMISTVPRLKWNIVILMTFLLIWVTFQYKESVNNILWLSPLVTNVNKFQVTNLR